MTGNNSVNQKKKGRGPTHWIKVQLEDGSFHTIAGVWTDTKNGERRLRGKRLASLNLEALTVDKQGNLILPLDTRFWVFETKANTGA